jgi:flagellar basal body P-ring formation protein FlgA
MTTKFFMVIGLLVSSLVVRDLHLQPVSGGNFAPKAGALVSIVEFPAGISPQILLRVRLETPGEASLEQTLVLRANLWRSGWKLRQPSQRGDILDTSALEPVRIDVLRERDALSSMPQGDYIFTRAVQPDRLLIWRDLAARPIVRRGQVVEVVAQSGPVSVSLKGMAMQDGARNETIRIRNIQSNREFTAQVTGENRAVIRL